MFYFHYYHQFIFAMSRRTTAATAEPTPAPQATGEEEGIDLNLEIVQVEELQNHGINMSDIQKLKSAGVHSVSV